MTVVLELVTAAVLVVGLGLVVLATLVRDLIR
jgi:hypothetical protein